MLEIRSCTGGKCEHELEALELICKVKKKKYGSGVASPGTRAQKAFGHRVGWDLSAAPAGGPHLPRRWERMPAGRFCLYTEANAENKCIMKKLPKAQ